MSSALNTQAFIKPGTPILKFNNRKQLPIHRLPFVGRVPGRPDLSFWNVPKTGSYAGGCKTGKALAHIYLKHLREHGKEDGGILQSMVMDMCGIDPMKYGHDTVAGQIVGFMAALEPWLVAAAIHAGHSLDHLNNDALLELANNGLNFVGKAQRAEQEDGE